MRLNINCVKRSVCLLMFLFICLSILTWGRMILQAASNCCCTGDSPFCFNCISPGYCNIFPSAHLLCASQCLRCDSNVFTQPSLNHLCSLRTLILVYNSCQYVLLMLLNIQCQWSLYSLVAIKYCSHFFNYLISNNQRRRCVNWYINEVFSWL